MGIPEISVVIFIVVLLFLLGFVTFYPKMHESLKIKPGEPGYESARERLRSYIVQLQIAIVVIVIVMAGYLLFGRRFFESLDL